MIELDNIYNMDCLEGMKQIPDGTIDAVICDLPYGTTACAWDSVIPFEPLWEQFKRVTKPNSAIVLFGGEPFSSALRMSNIGMYKYDWYWRKPKGTGFLNAQIQPLRDIETISVFYRQQPTYNPQFTKGSPYTSAKGGKEIKDRGNTTTAYGDFKTGEGCQNDNPGIRYPRQCVDFNTSIDFVGHPTQKPVDLLRYLILTYSNEGDTILDATIGSGTTAVAALMEKRHFIGFETNKEYFDIAQGRIGQVLRNPTLF